MDDAQLLMFRWGTERYGISTAIVAGVTGVVRINRPLEPAGEEVVAGLTPVTPAMGRDGDSQRMILIHAKGIQVALIVDEVIEVVDKTAIAPCAAVNFKIWRTKGGAAGPDD